MAFENIAKSLFTANQLPLDAKTWFPTLTQMKVLGAGNYLAYQYYEYMRVTCVETGSDFVWKEVASDYTGGVLDDNFLYPADVLTELIDYSNRYFNFVPITVGSGGSSIGNPYLIWKHPNNSQDYLEVNDVVRGYFSSTQFRTMRYKGGPLNDETSWAKIDSINPMSYD